MRIAVVGLGGVGGYICAMLCKTNNEVVGFARGKHLQEIQQNGLEILEDENSWNTQLDARELKDASGYFDLVLFCVKSYDLKEAYKKMALYVDSQTIMLSFSNGVGNGDILRDLSSSKVLDACVYIISHVQKAGVIRKKGKVFAAVFGGLDAESEKLAEIFESAGLRYKTPENIEEAIWKKYIFISAFATACSYYENTIGYVYEHHKDEVRTLLNEIAKVALEKGIEIQDEVQKALDTASKIPYDSSPSMYLDFKNKKRVELENLSGYIKKPLMQKMYEELKKRV